MSSRNTTSKLLIRRCRLAVFVGLLVVPANACCDSCSESDVEGQNVVEATVQETPDQTGTEPSEDTAPVEAVPPLSVSDELRVWPVEVLLESDELTLEEQAWEYQDLRGRAWRVRVPLDGDVRVQVSDEIMSFNAFLPADAGPWAVINGGFYDRDLVAMGLVVADGVEHHPIRRSGGSGVFLVSEAGPRIVHRTDWEPGPAQALQSIDRLVAEGVSVVNSRDNRGAARSAVAIGRDHLWLVVAVSEESTRTVPDGVWLRWTAHSGLPLWAFADYITATTNAISALNLDGGGSTSLAVTTGDQLFRVIGERGTINALVVRP